MQQQRRLPPLTLGLRASRQPQMRRHLDQTLHQSRHRERLSRHSLAQVLHQGHRTVCHLVWASHTCLPSQVGQQQQQQVCLRTWPQLCALALLCSQEQEEEGSLSPCTSQGSTHSRQCSQPQQQQEGWPSPCTLTWHLLWHQHQVQVTH